MEDERLKPVRCGCGGEAKVIMIIPGVYAVECSKCWIRTGSPARTEAEAVEAWNKAMSANVHDALREALDRVPSAEPERKTGEWKTVAFLTAECSECGAQVHELEYNNYCPNCGVDMRGDNGEA